MKSAPRGPLRIALKIDVDTRRGMDEGVPRLLETLAGAGIRATFFVTMGPDNSGKAALRVFRRKGFAKKMVRTNALRMYGLRTALSGTLLPARPVGSGRPDLLRAVLDGGHEAGVHGWDHILWHDRNLDMAPHPPAGPAPAPPHGQVGRGHLVGQRPVEQDAAGRLPLRARQQHRLGGGAALCRQRRRLRGPQGKNATAQGRLDRAQVFLRQHHRSPPRRPPPSGSVLIR